MNSKVESWKSKLDEVCESLKGSTSIDLTKMNELESQIMDVSNFMLSNEENLNPEALKKEQLKFRTYTDDIFMNSHLYKRARTWPRGYAGDYETLEKIYHATPVKNEGVGMYLDNYFITRELARGVRERKRVLSKVLISEFEKREKKQKVLNIACGSSREIFDIGKKMNNYEADFTFLDYDKDAVNYSRLLLFNEGIDVRNFKFMKYNALNLVSETETEAEFGKKDIIYSAGLFDYIKTDVLIKMISSLYNLLEDGGVLIAPFKDKENYNTFDYHYLVDWSYFYQRTIDEVKDILVEATNTEVEIINTKSPAINFFLIRKK